MSTSTQPQTFKVSKMAGKGVVQGVISVTALLAAIAFVRGFMPGLLWPAGEDAQHAQAISDALSTMVAAAAAVSYLIGIGKNIWKNWHLIRGQGSGGFSALSTLNAIGLVVYAAILALFGFVMVSAMQGCTITTPGGAYSFAIDGQQLGVAADLTQKLANSYQDFEATKASLEEAKAQGKVDRVSQLTDKLAGIRQKIASLKTKIAPDTQKAQELLAKPVPELPAEAAPAPAT